MTGIFQILLAASGKAVSVDFLVIAGGGSGAATRGGGGGGGGVLQGTSYPVGPNQLYTIQIGAGGAGAFGDFNGYNGANGSNSVISAGNTTNAAIFTARGGGSGAADEKGHRQSPGVRT